MFVCAINILQLCAQDVSVQQQSSDGWVAKQQAQQGQAVIRYLFLLKIKKYHNIIIIIQLWQASRRRRRQKRMDVKSRRS